MRTAKWNIIIFKFCSATVGMRNFHFENKCLFLFEEMEDFSAIFIYN